MDNTAKETWIDKLIDELVDTKDTVADNAVDLNQFYTLIKLIFNNARLDYSGESLRIENEEAIFEYLKVIDPNTYYSKLKALKDEAEAQLARARHDAEIKKAQESKDKKEA